MSTDKELEQAERISAAVYDYARRQTFTLYHDAVGRGVINQHQAEALMSMWLERHPYEPLAAETEHAE